MLINSNNNNYIYKIDKMFVARVLYYNNKHKNVSLNSKMCFIVFFYSFLNLIITCKINLSEVYFLLISIIIIIKWQQIIYANYNNS